MSIFDWYDGVQMKIGDPSFRKYNIGDYINVPDGIGGNIPVADGIYIGYEGVIVVLDGKLIVRFDGVYTKWGQFLNMEDLTGDILFKYHWVHGIDVEALKQEDDINREEGVE